MAKVIKGGDAPLEPLDDTEARPVRRKVISGQAYEARSDAAAIMNEASAKAEDVLGQAKAQAAKIIQDAETEAKQLRDSAHTQGYEDGREAGASEAMEVVADAVAKMQAFEAEIVPQLKTLALAIAKKILGKELDSNPATVVDIVRQALAEKARQRTEIFIRVHPEDIDMLREHKPMLLEVLSKAKDIAVREDPSIERHGVVIETDAGRIDAQLSTQLEVFERVLNESS